MGVPDGAVPRRGSPGDGDSPVVRLTGRFWDGAEASPSVDAAPLATLGGRRRKTLAPPAWKEGCEGSRFSCLGDLTADPSGIEDGRVAVEAAEEVLADDWPVNRDDIQRPAQSEGESVAEFWEKVGYPTPASRVWERPSSSSSNEGKGLSSVCRSPVSLPKERSVADELLCKADAVATKTKVPGRPLRRPPMRVGWRGPLPKPRFTPPPCLGDFLPELPPPTASRGAAESPAGSGGSKHASITARSEEREGAPEFQNPRPPPGGTQVHAAVGRRSPWAHLGHWFEGLWRGDRVPRSTLIHRSSPAREHAPPPACCSATSSPPTPASCSTPHRSLTRSFAEVASASPRMAAPPPGYGPPTWAPAPATDAQARGAGAAFGNSAGPPTFTPRQLGAGHQGPAAAAGSRQPVPAGFAFGTVAQAPKRKKKKKNNTVAGQVQQQGVQPVMGSQQQLQQGALGIGAPQQAPGGQQLIPGAGQSGVVPVVPVTNAAVQDVVAAAAPLQVKKPKAWCWKCAVNTHATKECPVKHYCHICENAKHPTPMCPSLKLPRPTVIVAGQGHKDTMFIQFPDSLFKDEVIPNDVPVALVKVQGTAATAKQVETQVARLCPVQSWRWEAIPNGVDAYTINFPSKEDLMRFDGIELGVPSQATKLMFSIWKPVEVEHKLELHQTWVHVTGVPNPLRHFWGLWAVGSLIGTTIDVDTITLRRQGVVRILVGMMWGECFKESDEEGLFIRTDGVLRLKGYDFTFRPEREEFIPEADFVPFVWQRKGKGGSDDNGMEDDGPDDLAGQDGAVDNSGTSMAIDPSPATGGGQSQGAHKSQVLMGITVTPFNPNPQTPRAKELVKQWKDSVSGSPDAASLPLPGSGSASCGPLHLGDGELLVVPAMHCPASEDGPLELGCVGGQHAATVTVPSGPVAVAGAPQRKTSGELLQPTNERQSEVAGGGPKALVQEGSGCGVQETVSMVLPAVVPQPPADAVVNSGTAAVADSSTVELLVGSLGCPMPGGFEGSTTPDRAVVVEDSSSSLSSPIAATGASATPCTVVERAATSPPPSPIVPTPAGGRPLSTVTPRRSGRHRTASDGASATDEDSMAKAMRRKAASFSSPVAGTLPLHKYSPYVVHLTTGGISRPLYGGVCKTGGGGEGHFFTTWVAA